MLVSILFALPLYSLGSSSTHENKAKVEVSKTGLYGAALSVEKVEPLSELVSNYSKIKNKDVCIEGEVKKVCSNSGCWMQVKSGDVAMRVTFKDYGFFVPESLLNKKVKLQGRLFVRKIRGADKSKSIYKFKASGVQVL